MTVSIRRVDNHIHVSSPYHPDFPPAARQLGGKWDSDVWVFDARDDARVRGLCCDIYGTDGDVGADDDGSVIFDPRIIMYMDEENKTVILE